MDDKILNIFRTSNGEFISGEEISEKLKARAAARKQALTIRTLYGTLYAEVN